MPTTPRHARTWPNLASLRPLNRRFQRLPFSGHVIPLLVLLVSVQVLLFAQGITGAGLPRGMDMNASLVAGSQAEIGAWDQVWDDSRTPGAPGSVSRLTVPEIALNWLTSLTGGPVFSLKSLVWLARTGSAATMYVLLFYVTGSRLGAVAGALVYVTSRGAALYLGLPLAFGYALLPVLFLFTDLVMRRPTAARALAFALAAALFFTSTAPGFSYAIAIALAVYVIAVTAYRLMTARHFVLEAKATALRFGWLAGGVAVALLLSTYLITALWASTRPLAEADGGFTLENIALRAPTLFQALAQTPAAFIFESTATDIAALVLVIILVPASLLALNSRVAGIMAMWAAATFFAVGVDSTAYRLIFDNLPYFDFVRGATRWIAVSAFAISLLTAVGISILPASGATVSSWLRTRKAWPRWRRVALAASTLTLLATLSFIALHVPQVRKWYGTYTPPSGVAEAYRALSGRDGGFAFSTSPFLATRLTGDPYVSAIDFGRTLGPALSGHPAFGGFRAGGLDVNENVLRLVEPLKTEVAAAGDFIVTGPSEQELVVLPADFDLIADISSPEDAGAFGVLRIVMRDRARADQVVIEVSSTDQRVRVLAGTASPRLIASAPLFSNLSPGILRLRKTGQRFSLSIADASLDFLYAGLGPTSLLASTDGQPVTISGLEARVVERRAGADDDKVLRLLALYGVRYHLLQSYAGRIEKIRFTGSSITRPVGDSASGELLEIQAARPDDAYTSEFFGLLEGDPVPAVWRAFDLPAVSNGFTPLVDLDAVPASIRTGVASAAAFRLVPPLDGSAGNGESSSPSSLPRVMYPAPAIPLDTELPEPYRLPSSLYVDSGVVLWSTSQNIVWQGRVQDVGQDSPAPLQLEMRSQLGPSRLVLELPARAGTALLSESAGDQSVIIDSASFEYQPGGYSLRLATTDNRVRVWVDGLLIINSPLKPRQYTGPLVITSSGKSALVTGMAMSTLREGERFMRVIEDEGFDLARASELLDGVSRGQLGLFPGISGQSFTFSGWGTVSGRLLVGVPAGHAGPVHVAIDSGDGDQTLKLAALRSEPGGTLQWLLSETFTPSDGDVAATVATQAPETGTTASAVAFLIDDSPGGTAARLAEMLVRGDLYRPVETTRVSATRSTGKTPSGGPGIIVHRASFNAGWRMKTANAETASFPVFGTLNGFWHTGSNSGQEFEIVFAPQRWVTAGMFVSAAALIIVVVLYIFLRRREQRALLLSQAK